MVMKSQVINSLKRERRVCSLAIEHLESQCKEFEKRYYWTTDEFLQKFEEGLAGDNEDFFKWYAIAQGLADWKSTMSALEEVLVD
ncbi:MAG: hypothetical protein A2889_01890 [Nitrospinae bacterium RIFCSPLOWO2_01_FULL_39_10]|nr:MAG: hypothetical protein A2889_01890 [Nitrospinae bacterium RIFCSPLOWO2_01_FULL_39_10]